MKSAVASLLISAMLLAGCANDTVSVAKAHHRNHVSPPQVAPPDWPSDSFDQAAAGSLRRDAAVAFQAGKFQEARTDTEKALQLWPVAIDGWEQFIDDCTALADDSCLNYAIFFHAKLLVLNGLPMRAASLGFETVAENREGDKLDNRIYDRQTLEMATRLWVFCSQKDPVRSKEGEPTQQRFDDAYPYAPALLVIGIGAGLLSGIKSVANK